MAQLPDVAEKHRAALKRACDHPAKADSRKLKHVLGQALITEDASTLAILNVLASLGDDVKSALGPERTIPPLSSFEVKQCMQKPPRCPTDRHTCYFAQASICPALAQLEARTNSQAVMLAFKLRVGDHIELLIEASGDTGRYHVLKRTDVRRPYVAVTVAANAHYFYRFVRDGQTLKVGRRSADIHVVHRLRRPETRCLDLRFALPSSSEPTAVLLDGTQKHVTKSRNLVTTIKRVPLGKHVLSIVRGQSVTRETIHVKLWKGGRHPICQPIHLDLTRTPHIALVDVTVGAQCQQLEVDPLRLRVAAEWYLRGRLGANIFKNNHRLARTIRSLRQQGVPTSSATPTGQPRGQYDTNRILDKTEGELRRQGITDALFLHVTCGEADTQTPTFNFEVTRFDLLAQADKRKDHLRGTSIAQLKPSTESINGVDELRQGLAAVLSRSLELPYVRWSGTPPAEKLVLDPVELFYDSYRVGTDTTPTITRLSNADASRRCSTLRDNQRLYGHDALQLVRSPYRKSKPHIAAREKIKSSSFTFTEAEAGTYLVELPQGSAARAVDAQCVRIVRPRFVVTGDGAYGLAIGPSGAEQYSRFRLGVRFQDDWADLDVGTFIGGAVMGYRLEEPRTWDGSVSAEHDVGADGVQHLQWEKRSFLAGGELHYQPLRHHVGLLSVQGFFSPSVAFNISYFDATQVPGGVGAFDNTDNNDSGVFDIDVDLLLRTGLRFSIGPYFELEASYHGGFTSFDDLVIGLIRRDIVSGGIKTDPAFIVAGGQLGIGWGLQ